MRVDVRQVILALVVTFVGGCSGIDRKALQKDSELPPAGIEVSETSTGPSRPLSLPLKVAVYLAVPGDETWNWTAYDRGVIASWGKKLKSDGVLDELLLMSSFSASGGSLSEIRQAASILDSDLVLVMQASGQINEGWNPLALFYLTLIGYYILPGSHADAVMLANGTILEVESGRSLAAFAVEGKDSTIAPGGWIDSDEVRRKARARALRAWGKKFDTSLRTIAAGLPQLTPEEKQQVIKAHQSAIDAAPGPITKPVPDPELPPALQGDVAPRTPSSAPASAQTSVMPKANVEIQSIPPSTPAPAIKIITLPDAAVLPPVKKQKKVRKVIRNDGKVYEEKDPAPR
jgi:hypothetical protein